MTDKRLSDAQYRALDYDAWQRHVYTTGDQRFNNFCMVCSVVQSVSNPLRSNTVWWVCADCKEEEE